RSQLLRISTRTLRDVAEVWSLLNPADLDTSFIEYSQVMEKLIGERKQLAASVTYGYVKELKKVLIGGDIPYVDTPALEYDKLNTSLKVLGPITIKQHIKDGEQYVEAANVALRRTQGAAVRHTYGGARELLDAVVAADQDALGWKR